MVPTFRTAINQIRANEKNLIDWQDNDNAKFIEEIQKLDFWNSCMETGLETLFRMTAYNQATGEQLFNNTGIRNCVVDPVDGRVGHCARWLAGGPYLGRYDARSSDADLGLGLSCTAG